MAFVFDNPTAKSENKKSAITVVQEELLVERSTGVLRGRWSPAAGARVFLAAFAAVAVLLGVPSAAHAYVDPGVGSYILQVVIGTIAAAGFGVKIFWRRIREAVRTRFARGSGDRDPGK